MRRTRWAIALVCALAVALIGGACDLVAGDSLVVNAAAVDPGATRSGLLAESNVDGVVLKGVNGIAPCDYRTMMNADYGRWKPKRVSLVFSGNSFTNCMKDSTGKQLSGTALVT